MRKLRSIKIIFSGKNEITEKYPKVSRNFWKLTEERGEGNGNPLQYSCLENPRNRGAWWAAVYGVAESDTTEVT